jgi:RNA polymerase sigma-70 factor (ECF subfamily)
MEGEVLHFAPWLYRIALNLLRSEWRKRKHVAVISLAALPREDDECGEAGEDYLGAEEPFEEHVVELDLVRQVLSQLPPASAECLLLDAEGFTYAEIAEILQDSLSAVRSRLSRSRQAFRRIYAGLNREGVG